MIRIVFFLTLLIVSNSGLAQVVKRTPVLIVGGGASGIAAGLQCARMGVNVVIAEETTWLGGMITAAGVSAFDGNHNMPSGIWAEFRQQLYQLYGGPEKVATGWVSNTQFEPHVGDSLLKKMAAAEPRLSVLYKHRFVKTLVKGKQTIGAVFIAEPSKTPVTIYASQVIDATELGDVMASAGIPYDIGMEASSITGENINIPANNTIIQDLTYVAILKDFGPAADCTIAKPVGYNAMEFDGCCNEFCSKPDKLASDVTAKQMLDYGKLPNGKYMINWPGKGNDIYLDIIEQNHQQRQTALQLAKAKTMRYVYFLQTQFGFKNLALATDEFPTADRLALIAYHRESRRLKGMTRFRIQHIAQPFKQQEQLYRTGVAVGDYPIDHHHRENPDAPQHLGFYPVPSYNLPLGVMIPQQHNGIIVAEKSTSISNVVNGTTRLQPIVMLTGQAAGTLAALCIKQNKQPRNIAVRAVQSALLDHKAYIMPYFDVPPTHPHFVAIQKIGATGILRGVGEPFKWANRTWFYPDSLVDATPFIEHLSPYYVHKPLTTATVSQQQAMQIAGKASGKNYLAQAALLWKQWNLGTWQPQQPITRAQMAVLLQQTIRPFQKRAVSHSGLLKK
jgi:hypothetical protein